MKKAIITTISLLVLICSQAIAQNIYQDSLGTTPFSSAQFYLGLGVYVPAPIGGVFAVTAFSQKGWGGSCTIKIQSPNAKNLPADFSPGLIILGDGIPDEYIKTVTLRALKEVPTDAASIRFGFEVGPAFESKRTLENFRKKTEWLSANYSYDQVTHRSLGLSIKGKMEFPISKYFGFEFGLTSNLYAQRSYLGFDLLLTLGQLRD